MQNFPNKKDRILVLALWFPFFIVAVSFDIFLLAYQDIGTILTAVISMAGTIYLSILIKPVSKGYFLKYYFNQKKFKELYNESIKKFSGASEEFLKEFKERCHTQYLLTGDIFYYPTIEDDKWLLSDINNIQGLIWITDILRKSIVDKSGFNYFIDISNALTKNGDLTIHTTLNNFYSGELRYLLIKVYEETGLNLDDNGLSDEYTKKVNDLRERLKKEYDKLLYNFEEEVESIYLKIKDKGIKKQEETTEVVS